MNWEQRLREMILAGGALAATACGGSTSAQADAASTTTPGLGDDATVSGDDSGSSGVTNNPSNFCCNASSDPCCYLSCEPDAAILAPCQAQMECLDAGGTIGPNGRCSAPSEPMAEAGLLDAETSDGGPVDAAPADAGPTDAGEDARTFFFCCNANPDPCCPIAYCAGGVGPDAAIYVTCEQNRAQCESTNGYYVTQPDGSLGCTPASTTGH